MKNFVKLHPNDNVITITKETSEKTVVEINSDRVTVLQDIPFGHKLAIEDIEEGADVVKYGVKIGVSNTRIRKGQHVHVHNVDEVSLQIRDEAKKKSLGGS